ncbi:MAG: hypothetical protein IIC07_01190, partial [Proteobacteria bacterium]|nr:hypothetical protein [Pseudomonadota bacterium]
MARAIIFHSLAHARAALGAGREARVEICLVTAPGAARYAGADHLKKIADLALAEFEGEASGVLIDSACSPHTRDIFNDALDISRLAVGVPVNACSFPEPEVPPIHR